MIPILETERLRLRGHRLDDFEACVRLWADPGVTRYIGGKPSTRELTWARLLRYAGHWSMLGFGYWVLAPRMHGKGYGTEAVRAALAWGDRHLRSARTFCLIAPENAPSIRVAEKCGYREIRRTTYKDEPTLLFERG